MQVYVDKLCFVGTYTMGALLLRRPHPSYKAINALAEHIEAHGLYTPLVAYEKPDGCFFVLSGSRRLSALLKIREGSSERFYDLFPGGMIPIVYPK